MRYRGYTSFTCFADVQAYYDKITPLRGAQNKGKDIRPIADRRYKWERIVKIDDNCYALSDGHHYGDTEFPCYNYGAYYTPTLKDMERYAPIVWRKHKDGTETVTVRNGTGPGYHNSRYAFLYRHTPSNMWFRSRNGKHFIEVGGQEYFLAKGKTAPAAVVEQRKRAYGYMRDTRLMVEDDNASLVFRRAENGWVLVSNNGVAPTPPKRRVDKETKKQLKPHIDAFRDWVLAMAPLMPGPRDWEYRRRMHSEWNEWAVVNGYEGHMAQDVLVKVYRQIVKQEDHPMRVYLAHKFKCEAEIYDIEDKDDLRRAKQRLNNHLNNYLGLVNLVED